MNDDEKEIIKKFAAGDDSLRDKAIFIHRNEWMSISLLDDKIRKKIANSPEHLFMREVDNPVPDYTLRNLYRKALLKTDDEDDADGVANSNSPRSD